jgi:hypothetical protein
MAQIPPYATYIISNNVTAIPTLMDYAMQFGEKLQEIRILSVHNVRSGKLRLMTVGDPPR